MVRIERSRTGHFYSYLDPIHLHVWNLFQTVRFDEWKKMSFDLIYPAIIVFLLMAIGIVLTIVEFKNLEKGEPESTKKHGSDPDRK